MKKLFLITLIALFTDNASAQAPFTYYQPTPPPSVSVPSLPSLPDLDYNYRRVPRRFSSSIPNGINGTTLGVTGWQETIKKLAGLGYTCRTEASGYFARVVTTQGCKYEDASFRDICFYFFKDRLWSITFEDCQSDPRQLGNIIESKYADYSVSDTNYEYVDGDVILTFDGNDLVLQSNTILNLIAKSANGN